MLRNPGLRKSVEQPVLDLNFAASQIGSNGAPDSRIDFSRGNNAWFVDTDGLVKRSPHNLLQQSQTFDTTWSQTGCSVTANSVNAPDATLTGYKLIKNAAYGFASLSQNVTLTVTAGRATATVYAKAGERDKVALREGVVTGGYAAFDLTNGTILDETNVNEASITSVGNGWFRILMDVTLSSGTTFGVRIVPLPDSYTSGSVTASFSDDGTSGVYIWGSQVSEHSYDLLPVDNPYIKTEGSAVYAARLDHDPSWFMSAAQEQNLFTNSEMLDETGSTGWTATRTVVTKDSTEDPNGDTTAEKVLEDSTASNSHFVRSPDFTVTKGKSYTASAYVKVAAGTDRLFRLAFTAVDSAFTYVFAQFDLQSGIVQFANTDDSSITNVGNGWYRISATLTASATADTAEVQFAFVEKGGTASYDGDGTSGFFVWGAQVEVGSTASTYHRTEGAPYYGPGATPKGLLIEEARTNLVTGSESATYFGNNVNVTQTANSALAPDGTNTAVLVAETTDTGSHHVRKGTFTCADNQPLCFSAFVKANGRTTGSIEIFNAGGIYVSFDLSAGTVSVGTPYDSGTNGFGGIEDYGNGWFRLHCGLTTKPGDTSAKLQIRIGFGDYAGDTTKGLYIWGFQAEQGSFPTSYIKTTGTTLTRNAEVAMMGPTTGGTELVTNGTFDTDVSNWVEYNANSSITFSSGTAIISNNQYNDVRQVLSLVEGRRYRASMDVITRTSGAWFFLLQHDSTNTNVQGTFADGSTQTFDFTAGAVNTLRIYPYTTTNPDTIKVDNISVRELYPFEQYNPAEGTVVCEFERNDNTTFDYIWDIGFGTNNQNSFALLHLDATRVYHSVLNANVQQMTYSPTTVEPGDTAINAFAYQANNVNSSFSRNGSFTHSFNDTSYSIPPADKMSIGSRQTQIGQHSGYIKRLTYYPYRLNDAVCDSKVSS